jgi:hypothetical protein
MEEVEVLLLCTRVEVAFVKGSEVEDDKRAVEADVEPLYLQDGQRVDSEVLGEVCLEIEEPEPEPDEVGVDREPEKLFDDPDPDPEPDVLVADPERDPLPTAPVSVAATGHQVTVS